MLTLTQRVRVGASTTLTLPLFLAHTHLTNCYPELARLSRSASTLAVILAEVEDGSQYPGQLPPDYVEAKLTRWPTGACSYWLGAIPFDEAASYWPAWDWTTPYDGTALVVLPTGHDATPFGEIVCDMTEVSS